MTSETTKSNEIKDLTDEQIYKEMTRVTCELIDVLNKQSPYWINKIKHIDGCTIVLNAALEFMLNILITIHRHHNEDFDIMNIVNRIPNILYKSLKKEGIL